MTRTAIPHVVWGIVTLAAIAAPLAAQSQSTYAGHGADSVPREKIVKYAPPPLPAEVTRRIQTMLDVRGAVLGLIAPDGKRLFFTWGITGTPNVWRLDGPKGFPIQMTGGEDPTRVAGVTPDGRTVIVSRDVGGQETRASTCSRPTAARSRVIHHKPKTRAGYAFTTDDSKAIYFSANDIKPDSYAIYRYDLATRQRELVFDQPGLWSVSDHRGDGGGAEAAAQQGHRRAVAGVRRIRRRHQDADAAARPEREGRVPGGVCRRAWRVARAHQQARRVPPALSLEARRRADRR